MSRYNPLPPSFHAANRAQIVESIGPDAIAVIDTAYLVTRTGDYEYPYRPDSNFYYLTGIDQPEAVLILAPGHPDRDLRELLFIRPSDPHSTAWEGEYLTQEDATRLSGIQAVFWLDQLEPILDRLLQRYSTVYLNTHESVGQPRLPTPSHRRAADLRRHAPLHQLRSALPLLIAQRAIKTMEEISQIRRAIAITAHGLEAARRTLKPGLREYELEAELAASFIRQGAGGHAFSPIVASGPAATVIHYQAGDRLIAKDHLVLLDVGAEYGYYAADISRVFPASGRFTARQRAIYDLVLQAQTEAISLHRPGASILSINQHIQAVLLDGLARLGLLTPAQATGPDAHQHLSQFYPHYSHHLGLDVHDPMDLRTPFQPGMVVTCEPGLYLKDEGLGIRLEDDILITENEPEVLSAAIPNSPDEIEALYQ